MFMSAMVRKFSRGERWNVLFNETIAKLNRTIYLSSNENIRTIDYLFYTIPNRLLLFAELFIIQLIS